MESSIWTYLKYEVGHNNNITNVRIINIGDDDYQPPQWYRQQERKFKKEPEAALGPVERKPDIKVTEEFGRDFQIDISWFDEFFNKLPSLSVSYQD